MKQHWHRHMGSLRKSIALTSSLAEDGAVLFQAVLAPGVCPLIVPFGHAVGAVASWLSQATNLNCEAIFSDVASTLGFNSSHP